MVSGTVREWHDDEGWGVIDTPETPGGCWAHSSAVRMTGFRRLDAGDEVHVELEQVPQDGYDYRVTAVWPPGIRPGSPDPAEALPPGTAYSSRLVILPPPDR